MKKFKLALSVVVILFTVVTIFQNLTFTVTNYKIADSKLPDEFNGFRIVQISDLHNTFYDLNNKSLLMSISELNPDIIVITGDYMDKRSDSIDNLLEFTKEIVRIGDCYYVTGNHEASFCREYGYDKLMSQLEEIGVTTLENRYVVKTVGNNSITLAGLKDPLFREIDDKKFTSPAEIFENTLNQFDLSGYTILLSHRPYEFETYYKYKVNLVLSGHEHGGQFRFPFVGGIFAPGEGFFPKYESGVYLQNDTTMVVSRGLGNGEAPVRLFNQPELVFIELVK